MQRPNQDYLESQVLTATPQKLRWMLIEGALRHARQVIHHWDASQDASATEALVHCRAIVSELLSGVRGDESPLTRQVAGLYSFLFRHLMEAQLHRDRSRVDETIAILEIESETWRLVCEQLPERPASSPDTGGAGSTPSEILAPNQGVGGPPPSAFQLDA
jgi:flagellar protein FliS